MITKVGEPTLIYKDTLEPVKVGDVVYIDDQRMYVRYFKEPHKPSSQGHVSVAVDMKTGNWTEYYASVIGAWWVGLSDREDPVFYRHACEMIDKGLNIINVSVDWHEKYGNDASFQVVLARDIDHNKFVYDVRDTIGGVHLRADNDDVVRFMYRKNLSDTWRCDGFAGSEFCIKALIDGRVVQKTFRGAWSSNSISINQVFADKNDPVVEVSADNMAFAVRVQALQTCLEEHPDFRGVWVRPSWSGLPLFTPMSVGGRIKNYRKEDIILHDDALEMFRKAQLK